MSLLSYRTSYLKFTADRGPLGDPAPLYEPSGSAVHPLPRPPVSLAQPLERVLRLPSMTRPGPLNDDEIALLTYWGAGLRRFEPTDAYPLHRAVPAPRCRYTAELHYVSFGVGARPAGAYRYDPRQHALHLRPTAPLTLAVERLREQCPSAPDGWLISAVPRRLQHLYGEFAARLMLLEAGHLVGQLRLLSATLPTQTSSVLLLDDTETWPVQDHEIAVAAVCNGATHAVDPDSDAAPAPLQTAFEQCLTQRHSGHSVNGLYPLPVSLDPATFHSLAWRAVPEDLNGRLQVHAVVQAVDGLTPGLYTFNPGISAFELRRAFPPSPAVQRALFSLQGFQVRHCPVVLLISTDLGGISRFAAPLLAAGEVGQRLALNAASSQLFARPSLSHLDAELDALLGLTHSTHTVAYTLLVGRDRYAGFPVRLSL